VPHRHLGGTVINPYIKRREDEIGSDYSPYMGATINSFDHTMAIRTVPPSHPDSQVDELA
jgi:hypothetical protein